MGMKDLDCKDRAAEVHLVAERLGGGAARVELIDGAGHHPQADVPQETTAAVLAFLDDLRRTRAGDCRSTRVRLARPSPAGGSCPWAHPNG